METFSPSTLEQLTKAGWRPSRSVVTLGYRLALTLEGYRWFPAVKKFLQEFGDLRVTFISKLGGTDTFHFNPKEAAAGRDAGWVLKDYSPRIGNFNLCAIGEAYSDHLILFMDDTGKVYGGYDEFLCFIAESGEAAIEAICQGLPTEEIPELPE